MRNTPHCGSSSDALGAHTTAMASRSRSCNPRCVCRSSDERKMDWVGCVWICGRELGVRVERDESERKEREGDAPSRAS